MDYYFVLPETISLQENTQTEVILAIELHCDNPVDDKGNDYKFIENKFFFNESTHMKCYHGLTQGLGALLD